MNHKAIPRKKIPLGLRPGKTYFNVNTTTNWNTGIGEVIVCLGYNPAGLVTTHDLGLSSLEYETKGITNSHFQDQIMDGKLIFDYKLHQGPCPTTNALSIMAMEGLPVPQDI